MHTQGMPLLLSGVMGGRIWKHVWKDKETESGLGVAGSVLREHVASVDGRRHGLRSLGLEHARGNSGGPVEGFPGEEPTCMAGDVEARLRSGLQSYILAGNHPRPFGGSSSMRPLL